MDLLDFSTQRKLLSMVEAGDIIRYGTNQVPEAIYYVFSKEMDKTIPAALFEVWKFVGGYDHYFTRFLANDFELTKAVEIFSPKKHAVTIDRILAYRPPTEGLTDKEEFHFDVDAKETSPEPLGKFTIPYAATVTLDGEPREIILTQWTPLQQVPITRIREGTTVEVWEVDGFLTMMKVLRL